MYITVVVQINRKTILNSCPFYRQCSEIDEELAWLKIRISLTVNVVTINND